MNPFVASVGRHTLTLKRSLSLVGYHMVVNTSNNGMAATASRRLASTLSHLSPGNNGAAMVKALPIERITIFGGGLMGVSQRIQSAAYVA